MASPFIITVRHNGDSTIFSPNQTKKSKNHEKINPNKYVYSYNMQNKVSSVVNMKSAETVIKN